jgi:DNA-binding NarL/FixJ family response regulator
VGWDTDVEHATGDLVDTNRELNLLQERISKIEHGQVKVPESAWDLELPPIPAHKLRDRRVKVRHFYREGLSRKQIASKAVETEDVVKKDLAWLRKSGYLPGGNRTPRPR